MPVPDARVELQIGGVWTDVTQHVVQSTGVQLSYGRSDEGRPVDPGTGALTLLSPDGLYSNRNPSSPYYGKLGRNTPIRVSTAGGTHALLVPQGVAGRATTPDHASLDITGDLDVRVDLHPALWQGAGIGYELAGKYVTAGNQRSWRLMVTGEGELLFSWSPTGSSDLEHRSQRIPVLRQRQAVRATLDVNNGLGGYTLTYYVAPTLAGPWTQIGQTVTTSGTTGIFASTAPLEVGDIAVLGFTNTERRIYAFELRNGIGGPVVAAPDFTAQPLGTSPFTDSAGRAWTIVNGATITDRSIRVMHTVPTWPATWHRSGHDVRAPIETAGILRRLGQGKKMLASTLRRRIPSYTPLAYWPCEDGSTATQASSPVEGVAPLRVTKWSFGQDDTLAGSSPLPSVDASGTMAGAVPVSATMPSEWSVHLFYKVDSAPATNQEIFSWKTDGSLKTWRIFLRSGVATIQALDFENTGLINQEIAVGADVFSGWQRLMIRVTEISFGTIRWDISWTNIGGETGSFSDTSINTAGAVTQINTKFGAFSGLRVGHVTVLPTGSATLAPLPFYGADTGWDGEEAADRLVRLGTEEAQTLALSTWQGDPTRNSELLGPQRPGALLDLLQECADSDGGILAEDPQRMALLYRDRTSLENQAPVIIPYGKLTTPFEPSESDLRLRNDVTVERIGGSSSRVVQETGPLSVAEVGVYDESVPLSLALDAQPPQIAAWRLHLGTWDEARYPTVRLMLHKHPELIPAVSVLRVGDRVQITDTPPWMPPGPVDLIVQRIAEDIRTFTWDVLLSCSPGGPWSVAALDSPAQGRLDTDGTTLGAAVTATGTSLLFWSDPGPAWITTSSHPTEFPFDVTADGERMTVTGITPGASDAFGRTVAGGWGTADVGGTWTTLGGTAGDYAVGSGIGTHTIATVNASRRTALTSPSADFDLYVDVATSATATGGSIFGGLIARSTGPDDLYYARTEFTTSGTVILTIRKRLAAVETTVATFTTPYAYTPGQFFRLRFNGRGSTLRARVWPVGGGEPTAWQASGTDTSHTTAGVIGCRSITATGNTNTSPVVRYDSFLMANPQTATVTRAANGVSKSHAAGAGVQLAQPATVAL
ncbi:hypothetical protein ACWGN5_07725 [Streptomyces sp. NPDC055815]